MSQPRGSYAGAYRSPALAPPPLHRAGEIAAAVLFLASRDSGSVSGIELFGDDKFLISGRRYDSDGWLRARDGVLMRSRLAGLQLREQLPPEGVVLVQVGVRR